MKTIEEKRIELRNELINESIKLSTKGIDVIDHEHAIWYLNTGLIIGNGDLITSCIEDFDCIYSDYCL